LSQALEHFAKMKEQSLTDAISYNTMIKGYVAVQKSEAAHELVMEMISLRLPPNKASFHHVISLLAQRGDFRRAWSLVDEMISQAIDVSSATCIMLLKGICRQSQLPELSRTLAFMESHKVVMDTGLFMSIASACIRSGSLDVLWNRLLLQWQRDTSVISAATYTGIMKTYCQARDVQKVKQLWARMMEDKVEILHGTLGCVVEALNAHGLPEESWAVVSKLWEEPEHRELATTSIYSCIVNGFTVAKQHDKVLAVYTEMKDRKIPCDKVTFNTMLNAMARCGMMHDLPQLLDDMRKGRAAGFAEAPAAVVDRVHRKRVRDLCRVFVVCARQRTF
jgi:pentatricopeptide repeat protein